MDTQDFARLSLQLALMLACGLGLGQLLRRLRQPAVLGEMLGGLLLGPTGLGLAAPAIYAWLFSSTPAITAVRESIIKLGMLFFLFIVGLSVNLPGLRQIGRRALLIGLVGTILPIVFGVLLAYVIPAGYWGAGVTMHRLAFGLFVGMNLANSANPVLARILIDLGLLESEMGRLLMASTLVDDLVNWSLFALILSEIAPSASGSGVGLAVALLALGVFLAAILVIGRWAGPPVLHWSRRRLPWPNGFILLTAIVVLLAGSLTEYLGIHAFLGAFLAGAALSGEEQERNEAYRVIDQFASSFFAPIYFVSMGMSANFIQRFDAGLILTILAAACFSKLGAVLLGARLAGMPVGREAWAIAFGLNARGATGIILAGVGLEHGLIDQRLFVALVVMAWVTSLISGPAMNALIRPRPPARQERR